MLRSSGGIMPPRNSPIRWTVSEDSMQGLLVVGLVFGFGFLIMVGLHSVIRDLLGRQPLPGCSHGDDDAGEVLPDEKPSTADAVPDSGMKSEVHPITRGG